MKQIITPRPIGGSISAIASKSQAHRLLICAALADRESRIFCAEASKDIEATANCLTALGAKIEYDRGAYTVRPIAKPPRKALLPCAESGSTLRFLLPLAAALGVEASFVLEGRLPERPLSPLWEEMERHGCKLSRPTKNTLLCQGKLEAGRFCLAGNVSSQFISGLLFALPLLNQASELELTTNLESASYVDMTRHALSAFGVCTDGGHILPQTYRAPGSCTVEGDWSNAAFWLCAGAISKEVSVTGLDPASPQGDRKVLDILRAFGAEVSWKEDTITVAPQELRAVDINAGDIPDLVPPLALVAACARGTTRIFGAQRLKIKESDRLQSVAKTLNGLGGQVEVTQDGLLITGGRLTGGKADSFNDHRVAMLAAIASCCCTEPVILTGAEAVNKSYPRFWEDFSRMQKEETI